MQIQATVVATMQIVFRVLVSPVECGSNKTDHELFCVAGVNCYYDINTTLKTMQRIKAALDKENLKPYLMCQPIGWLCPEVENHQRGYFALPESPFGLLCSVKKISIGCLQRCSCECAQSKIYLLRFWSSSRLVS